MFGYINMCRRFYAEMKSRQRGVIINILGMAGEKMDRTYIAGSTGNAALMAFTKALANEMGPQGVRVNAILIGLVESGQWARRAKDTNMSLTDFYATMARGSNIPLGRFGREDEFADLCMFLLSARASYITGVGISLDGGMSPVI